MGCKKFVVNTNLAIQESPQYYKDHYYPFINFSKYNLTEYPKIETKIENYNFVKI